MSYSARAENVVHEAKLSNFHPNIHCEDIEQTLFVHFHSVTNLIIRISIVTVHFLFHSGLAITTNFVHSVLIPGIVGQYFHGHDNI